MRSYSEKLILAWIGNFIFIPKTRARKIINHALQPILVKKYEKNIILHRGKAIEPNEVDKIDEFTPKHTEIHVEQKN